ncbi:MAG: DJ-1/PfpI family protein [Polyangiales bacterium]
MSSLDRRTFLASLAAAGAATQLASLASPARAEGADGATPPATPAPLTIAMLIYPGCTALDFVAPQLTFAILPGATVHLVWKDLAPVQCDSGYGIVPTTTLADCPKDVDVLFVGGSARSTWPLMVDDEILGFLRDRGARARYVTSVCTGSLLLAAAGLLQGYQATSYWAVRHLLPQLGAKVADGRVVVDRNRITGGGVTAGVDFGLRLSEILRGRDFAELQQLMIEYAPEPPFAGSPDEARPSVVETGRAMYASSVALAEQFTAKAAARL